MAHKPIINFFVGADIEVEQYELSRSFLFEMLASMFPDAVRIMSNGFLLGRGGRDLIYPTVVNFLLMTVLGISIGAGIAYADEKNSQWFFWVRIIAATMAAVFSVGRVMLNSRKDKKLYIDAESKLKTSREDTHEIEDNKRQSKEQRGYGTFFSKDRESRGQTPRGLAPISPVF